MLGIGSNAGVFGCFFTSIRYGFLRCSDLTVCACIDTFIYSNLCYELDNVLVSLHTLGDSNN